MASHKALDSPESYTVGWIAALAIERAAAVAMLDEEHAQPTGFSRHQTDANVYTWGRMGEHNIVIASLAAGDYGTTSAATTASNLLATLPAIRIGLLVGIGGGIARPDEDRDIRLGDVVVSQPDGTTGGVCQYDLFKAKSGNKKERKGFLGRPPTVLLNALTSIQACHELEDSKVSELLQEMLNKYPKMGKKSKKNPGYIYQGFDNDRLFQSSYEHVSKLDCRDCDVDEEVERDPRETANPEMHYGIIASGNTLVKDAAARDRIVADVGEDCICFEMEAAGLMNHFPCLVIRGICDYADSHKNDRWQRYASATAAAYAKEFLGHVPAVEVQETKRALELIQSVENKVDIIQKSTIAMNATTETIKSDLQTQKIKRWISPPDPSINANHARKLRQEGTCAWLLETPIFKAWVLGSRQHLWLHGLAGCGKTVLSSMVLDYLTKRNDHLVLHFFFDFSDTTKQTVDGLLRSLVFQLYQSGVSSTTHLDNSFEAHKDGKDQPAAKVLLDIIYKSLTDQKGVYIVFDALDESTTRNELLMWIQDFSCRPELSHIQMIYTSRPESEFLQVLPPLIGEYSCFRLEKGAFDADIGSYVAKRIQESDFSRKNLSPDLLKLIQIKVGNRADGMFRWAACQLDSLARCPSTKAIKMALDDLPQDLSETYDRMLESIPKDLGSSAMRLLQFLVYSDRPLTVPQAVEIIATEVEEETQHFDIDARVFSESEVLRYCPGLVSLVEVPKFNENIKELHLAHFSVKEFLTSKVAFDLTSASIVITRTCLTYLADIKGSHSDIRRDFPLARYAAQVWTRFAALAETSEDVVQAAVGFLQDEITFQRWGRLFHDDNHWTDDPGPPDGSKLYYACLNGLCRTARRLLDLGARVNAQGGLHRTALVAASSKGHTEVVQLLLDSEAEVNAQDGYYGNALTAASLEGHTEVVQLLLDSGAEVNAQDGYYGNALTAASDRGHTEVVQLLLDSGAEVNAQGGDYSNALTAASIGGYKEVVKLLLDSGAEVNAQDRDSSNALTAASNKGHIEVVQLLLDSGAEVNTQGGNYGNALTAASLEGHIEVVQLLLDSGAEVNTQGGYYSNALTAASLGGYIEVVQLLLDSGAEVNMQGGYYSNALTAASLEGHIEVVQLLLDSRAEVNTQGSSYSNALTAASLGGYIEVVKLLLDSGAEVNTQGGDYSNALTAASDGGHTEVVQLLLDSGAEVNTQGSSYGNALTAASNRGYIEVVKLLLDSGAEVNTQGGDYSNALTAASLGGYIEVVQLLLDSGAEVNMQGGYYSNALTAASLEGYIEVVQLLLDSRAEVNVQGGKYSALTAASNRGYIEVVQLLLDSGAEVNTQGGDYSNALTAASLGGYIEVVQLLLDSGAEVNMQGGYYSNALTAASNRGHIEVVKLLLDRGA
ncbi:hypothetical protein EsH8_V_000076 [Colletotrichum jinshuiense]